MIQGKKILGIIPARGGSKGLPGKNIRVVAGKPLIAWTIEEAKKSAFIDRLILSSEDQEIIRVAREWDCEVPFVRPFQLAADDTPGIEPVLHALEALPEFYDYVVVLQPTSPLRSVIDIDNCIRMSLEHGARSCVSVTEVDKSPYWMYTFDDANRLTPLLPGMNLTPRRQDLPLVHALNGALYVAECSWLKRSKTFVADETIGFVMSKERSVDIDTELDLIFVEFFLSR